MITTEELHRDLETILELDPGTIKGHENLGEINWDSLSVIAFIAHMDGNYGISIPASKIKGAQKIEDLCNVVAEISR